MINDYFDRIYCINLNRRRDKWLEVQKEFVKHSLIVNRFQAIDASRLSPMKINAGAHGCLLSHDAVIDMARDDNLNSVLILEDDVVFDDDFVTKFEMWYPQVPHDWDMLYLGGNHNGLPVEKISDNVGRVKEMYATHAYAVKDNLYKYIADRLSNPNICVDQCYAEIQKTANCYCFIPLLAFQKEGYSDVLNANVNYDFELRRNQNKPLV
jgi:GR25 family glycosyltransferase involved in LPS biosynthesis